MIRKKLLLATLFACAFAPAFADETGEANPARIVTPGGANIKIQVGSVDELRALDGMPLAGPLMRSSKTVKNAPYRAEVVSERVQNLTDGNQIVNKSTSMSYRDSEGRTRHEMLDSKGEVRVVTIKDPVANVVYVLHPKDKTATKVSTSPEAGRAAAQAARARIDQLRKEGKLPSPERGARAGDEVIVKRIERADGDGARKVLEDVRIRVEQDAGDGKGKASREVVMQVGPLMAGAFGDAKWAAKASTRELGSREMNGVKVDGKLRSFEIPAGEIGNRNPIEISDEFWYSPELQVTVYSKHSDPRHGDTIFRLEDLKREEPQAALFAVPSDYTVKDLAATMQRRQEQKP